VEVAEAALVVHVRDIAHPDSEAEKADVLSVLKELDLERVELVEVLNKIDLLDDESRQVVSTRAARDPNVVALSALSGEGCDDFLRAIDRRLSEYRHVVALDVELADGAALAWLYRHAEVLDRRDDDVAAHLQVAIDDADEARFRRRFQPRAS